VCVVAGEGRCGIFKLCDALLAISFEILRALKYSHNRETDIRNERTISLQKKHNIPTTEMKRC